MTGDKIRRLRSIRKWLEKAEKSYTSDQDISGELNLIMAQAEMQRLKETDRKGEKRRAWGIRAAAFAAAVGIFSGISFLGGLPGTDAPAKVTIEALPAAESFRKPAAETAGPARAEAAKSLTEAPSLSPAKMPRDAAEKTPDAPAAAPVPVLSQQEIQSVVGEAGRALRGQS